MSDQLKLDLLTKYMALIDFLQECNQRIEPADLPNYAVTMTNAKLETQRVNMLLDLLSADQPINFPNNEQVTELQRSVGKLQQVVRRNAAINDLMAAATKAIDSWPVA
jgi:hypothetical protein